MYYMKNSEPGGKNHQQVEQAARLIDLLQSSNVKTKFEIFSTFCGLPKTSELYETLEYVFILSDSFLFLASRIPFI